jgi:hypothetical protein
MKHILNDISKEEKNRILEQHSGGKTIDTTKFKRLLESTMGNVKPLITEEEEMCKKEMSSEEFTKKVINACSGSGSSNCLKLGTKKMYPKTYGKLKSLKGGSVGYGTGCVETEGNGLVFYKSYTGWLNLLGMNCGDKIITIPKVPQSIKNFINEEDYNSTTWLIYGDSIYIYRWGGC